jgi:hypothetical protein
MKDSHKETYLLCVKHSIALQLLSWRSSVNKIKLKMCTLSWRYKLLKSLFYGANTQIVIAVKVELREIVIDLFRMMRSVSFDGISVFGLEILLFYEVDSFMSIISTLEDAVVKLDGILNETIFTVSLISPIIK